MKENNIIVILSFLLLTSIIVSLVLIINLKSENSKLSKEIVELENSNRSYKDAISNIQSSSNSDNNSSEDDYSNLVEIDYETFESLLSQKKNFIIVATQTTCSHCLTYKPILNKVLKEEGIIAYEIVLNHLDAEDRSGFKELTNVSGTPTTLFYKEGQQDLDRRLLGNQSEELVKEIISSIDYLR